jgi:hypothetical protein
VVSSGNGTGTGANVASHYGMCVINVPNVNSNLRLLNVFNTTINLPAIIENSYQVRNASLAIERYS